MTVNDFNSKIHLPSIFADQGITGFKFIRLFRFGWFAFNPDFSKIINIFDLGKGEDPTSYITYLLRDKQKFHEFKMSYSELAVKTLVNDWRIMETSKSFYQDCKENVELGIIKYNGTHINPKEDLIQSGYSGFLANGVGYCSHTLIDKYKYELTLSPGMGQRYIHPTWCTPQHICSLETYGIESGVVKSERVWVNGEKGWYGGDLSNCVMGLSELKIKPGFTWDKKADHWTNSIVRLDHGLDTPTCLQIWVDAKRTKFDKSPLDIIEDRNEVEKIKNYIYRLDYTQVQQLEKRFSNMQLVPYWQQVRQDEIKVGHIKFIQNDAGYSVQINSAIQEFTNFTMTYTCIFKKKNKYVREGYITCRGKNYSFQFDNDDCMNYRRLTNRITVFFIEQAIGLPTI